MCSKRVNPHANFAKKADPIRPGEKYCGHCGWRINNCHCLN
jgi:hypothetical protein